MGFLAAIKRLSFSALVAFNWLYAFFSRRPKLHGSRFARVDELANLTTAAPDQEGEGSLILGVAHLSRVLRVKPTRKRRSSLLEKLGRAGIELVLCCLTGERIKAVADTGRVDDKYRPEAASVACGLGKKIAFDVVNND